MATEFIPRCFSSSADVLPAADDLERPSLALMLMRDLEASLGAGRKALQSLDLAGIEGETREQLRLVRKLEAVLPRNAAPPARCSPELEEELTRCCKRILQAVRLQAALLARAQYKLRVLANMLAGRSFIYSRPEARTGALPLAPARNSGGGI
jgi:hypothetical protein